MLVITADVSHPAQLRAQKHSPIIKQQQILIELYLYQVFVAIMKIFVNLSLAFNLI
ncbi:unnamed protein product [Paramecium sonneborni]|uniref:Uncharacterized protein n=1 Tax=Paramecium sonneborni TaxID=65129 RepID=A0A8S1MAC9_9CILI|nr:unnamed protein product [Paramecium sonneborni]